MNEFVRPRNAVLNRAAFQKSILISVYNFENNSLQTVSEELGQDFKAAVQQGDWSIVVSSFWRLNFRDESYKTCIQALKI